MKPSSEKRRLADFFQNEYRRLVRFVQRRVDEIAAQDAEDFVQDIALSLFDKADISAPIEHLSAYVYRSLQNRIADYFRTRKPNISLELNDLDEDMLSLARMVAETDYDSASEIRRMEIAHDLYRLLDRLDDEEKSLIIATEIKGHTFRHLSEVWHVPVNTLLSRKARAMAKIRQQYKTMNRT